MGWLSCADGGAAGGPGPAAAGRAFDVPTTTRHRGATPATTSPSSVAVAVSALSLFAALTHGHDGISDA